MLLPPLSLASYPLSPRASYPDTTAAIITRTTTTSQRGNGQVVPCLGVTYVHTQNDKQRIMPMSNRTTANTKPFKALTTAATIVLMSLLLWMQNNTLLHQHVSNYPAQQNLQARDTTMIKAPMPKPPCKLLPQPAPMILITLGRSGTSSMYQVLSKLSGNETTRIYEYTGGSTSKSRAFFRDYIPKHDVNGDWLMQYLCDEQEDHPGAGVVAFKWKPYETIFEEEKALQGLELLGRLEYPQIKVVRSRRNLLDVAISR